MRRALALATILLLAAAPAAKKIVVDPAVAKDPASVKELESHRYDSPPVDLANTARSMLQEKGFVVPEQGDPLFFATDWKPDKKGGGKIRYKIEVVATSPASSRIVFRRIQQDSSGAEKEAGTDLDAEWALMSRVEPEAAAAIKAAAPPLPATPAPKRTPLAARPSASAAASPTATPAAEATEISTPAPAPSDTPAPRATPRPKATATPKKKKSR